MFLFFGMPYLQLVFLPPRSNWWGRGWYSVVSFIYDQCLWPHLLLFMDEMWEQITFSNTTNRNTCIKQSPEIKNCRDCYQCNLASSGAGRLWSGWLAGCRVQLIELEFLLSLDASDFFWTRNRARELERQIKSTNRWKRANGQIREQKDR